MVTPPRATARSEPGPLYATGPDGKKPDLGDPLRHLRPRDGPTGHVGRGDSPGRASQPARRRCPVGGPVPHRGVDGWRCVDMTDTGTLLDLPAGKADHLRRAWPG